ncbi:MAG TPA: phosphohydrolase [Puia sp.]|nr:phosphohydrolase [Puia sp.]
MNRLQFLMEWEARFVGWIRAHGDQRDGSHDLGHFQRVWKAARRINIMEGGPADELVLLAGAYFHDLVALPKDHPERNRSSLLSAEKTAALLAADFPEFPAEKIAGVVHAIHAHSFSAGVVPETVEAKILQDADRMEALGAIGIARVFYTAGQLGGRLFDAADPMAVGRELDDRRYALDHFEVKLFRLPATMNTVSGKALAEGHAGWMRGFVEKLRQEIAGENAGT